MKERPMLFKDEMVRAILEGRKTQTRRVVKPPKNVDPEHWMPEKLWDGRFKALHWPADCAEFEILKCPYGQPGDRLWVRETFQGPLVDDDVEERPDDLESPKYCVYAADGSSAPEFTDADDNLQRRWRPSIHMPRWASRITLEITSVRVERVQDIGYQDAQAEGVQTETADPWFYHISTERNVYDFAADEPQGSFRKLWESINGAGSWNANPWVWVIEFKRVPS